MNDYLEHKSADAAIHTQAQLLERKIQTALAHINKDLDTLNMELAQYPFAFWDIKMIGMLRDIKETLQ